MSSDMSAPPVGSPFPHLVTINVHGKAAVQEHCMRVHVLAEPVRVPQFSTSIVPTTTYGESHPGSSQVPICLRNVSGHPTVVPTKVIIWKVTPANWVPLVTLPMGTLDKTPHDPQKGWILNDLDLQGLKDWPCPQQPQPWEDDSNQTLY